MGNWELSTDRSTWTSLADAGITACRLRFVACGVDTADLTVSGDYLATAYAAYGATLYLRDDAGVQRFIGRVTGLPRMAQAQQEHYQVQLSGGWWWLERVAAQQRWNTRSPAAATYGRMVLCQDESGRPETLGASLRAAISNAIGRGAAIAMGSIADMATLPPFEVANQRCSDIVMVCLRYFPDHVVAWDYSGSVPVFSLLAPYSLYSKTINLATDAVTDIDIGANYADLVPGIRVIYEITSTYTDDETGETESVKDHVVDVAGSSNAPLAAEIVFPMRGTSTRRTIAKAMEVIAEELTQTIETESFFYSTKTFWVGIFFGTLGAIAADDWTLDDVEIPSFRYGRRLVSGAITSWMAEDYGHRVHLDTWVITVTIHRHDGIGNIVSSSKRRLACKFWSTNAESGTYTRKREYNIPEDENDVVIDEEAEIVPTGLAYAIYYSWSHLHYSGHVTVVGSRFYGVGIRLSITGGRSEWATMGSWVRQVNYDIGTDTCTLLLGPAARIEPDAALAIARASRVYSKPEFSRQPPPPEDPEQDPEQDPEPETDNTWTVGATLATSEQVLGEGDMGIMSRLMLIHPEDGQSITLDAAAVANIEEESEDVPALSVQTIWEAVPTFDESGNLTNLAFRQRQSVVGAPGTDTDVPVTDCSGA